MQALGTEGLPDELHGCRQILFHKRCGNTQHPKPRPAELGIPAGIQGDLLRMVEVPIDLHDESSRTTEEVDDVIADDLLAPKLDPEALAAHGGLEKHFRVGGIVPHEAGTSLEELFAIGRKNESHEDLSTRSDAGLARPLAQEP
jgi:hypothetical protein